LRDIEYRDFPSIFQAWIDAERVDHDLLKQRCLSIGLADAMQERHPSLEFLAQMRAFINDPANSMRARARLVSVLGVARRRRTTEILLEMAAHPPTKELKDAVLMALGVSVNEGSSAVYERAWREADPGNEDLLYSVARSMAGCGAASSMETLLTAALAPDGRDDKRKQAALYALNDACSNNANVVPPLAARLSNDAPESEASKLAGGILVQMYTEPATEALVAWLQTADASAATLAWEYTSQTAYPKIWQAALDPAVPFHSEQNREAIRKALAPYLAKHA
jgi:hypothetical protein